MRSKQQGRRIASGSLAGMALVAWLAAAAAGPLAELEREQQALFERVQPSIVAISDGRNAGSGFFVSRDGLVLTSAHVVGNAAEVDVVLPDGAKLRGKVLERAAGDTDLALVEVPRKLTPPLVLAHAPLRVGAWVGAVSHGLGGVWAFHTGMVTNLTPMGKATGDERPVFQAQIPLSPSHAGSPIFDKDGRVVGIVTTGIQAASSIHLAIRADLALARLTRLAERCDCLIIEAPPGTPIFVDDAHAGSGPRVVWPVVPGEHEVMALMGGTVWRGKVRFPETRKLVVPTKP
jgi:S1-C subfamily serine protease